MPSRTSRQAVAVLRDSLQRLSNCVSDRPLFATGPNPDYTPDLISFVPPRTSVPLRQLNDGPGPLFTIDVSYRVEEAEQHAYEARVVGYGYRILEPEGREILTYHWHPESSSLVTTPHLHLSTRMPPVNVATRSQVALGAMHIPTGVVTLAQVVRLLITEFGVEPRRPDWEAVLATATSLSPK